MKKELTICDLCSKDNEEIVEATSICEFCKKDICENCHHSFEFGDIDNGEALVEFDCCHECYEKTEFDEKVDKTFLNGLKKELKEYLTKKIMVENLNEKNS